MESTRQKPTKSKAPQHDSNDTSDETGEVHDGPAKSSKQDVDELMTGISNTNGQASPPIETNKSQDPSTKVADNKKARQKRYKAKALAKKRATADSTGGEEELISEGSAKKKQMETKDAEKISTTDSNGQKEDAAAEEPVKKKQRGTTDTKKVKKPKKSQKEKAEK